MEVLMTTNDLDWKSNAKMKPEKNKKKKSDTDIFWEEHDKYLKKIGTHIPESETEKAIIIMNAFFWSVQHHSNMPVCQNVKPKDVEKVWLSLHFLREGGQLLFLKEHAIYRIIFNKNGKTVKEIDVSQ
jgi:hypothetical protein